VIEGETPDLLYGIIYAIFGAMKLRLFLLSTIFFSIAALSQQIDTLPPYQQIPIIPPFKIQMMDSTSWFSKANLSNKKPTLIIYFSPDCGHCQLETEELISNIKALEKLQIVMTTSRPFEDVKNFYDYYKLSRFPTIKYGVDPTRFVVNFYKVATTPFSAYYDKKGNLVKVYEKGIDWKELLSMTK
jgi:thiol-disulfide isomerase/thioredoxin